jgi:hypothetical protein
MTSEGREEKKRIKKRGGVAKDRMMVSSVLTDQPKRCAATHHSSAYALQPLKQKRKGNNGEVRKDSSGQGATGRGMKREGEAKKGEGERRRESATVSTCVVC